VEHVAAVLIQFCILLLVLIPRDRFGLATPVKFKSKKDEFSK
jgi:hypothetical protein